MTDRLGFEAKARELGVKDIESLNDVQLRDAVETAEREKGLDPETGEKEAESESTSQPTADDSQPVEPEPATKSGTRRSSKQASFYRT